MSLWNNRSWTPMLLKECDNPFNSDEYLFEIKFDGARAVLFVSTKEVVIYNRHCQDITHLYPELQNIKKLVKRNTVFDGEIVSMEAGIPSFSNLQKRVHLKDKRKILIASKNNPIVFIGFDILYDDKDLTGLTLLQRKKILSNYQENDFFTIPNFIDTQGKKLYEKIKKLDLEGIVAKKKDSQYEINKRSESWLKIKNFKSDQFIIGGYIYVPDNHVISLVIGKYENDSLHYVGKVSLGKKTNLCNRILKEKIITKTPFIDFADKKISYIKPKLTCKVKYLELTDQGHLRQPFI